MMTRMRKVIFLAVVAVFAVWCFFPVRHCCGVGDETETKYEAVLARAIDGDLHAIRQLHDEEVAAKHIDEARYWALMGAIASDEELARSYVAMHKSITDEAKKADEVVIRRHGAREGARRLAAVIGLPL